MPYISKFARTVIRTQGETKAAGPGVLNYQITKLIDDYLQRKGLRYRNINEVIGVLECAKQELYRRVAAPYEDLKRDENGDVFTIQKEEE